MPEVSKEQVKDFIKNMTLLDAAALVKELEEELGVSAAAPVPCCCAGPRPRWRKKNEFSVILAEAVKEDFDHQGGPRNHRPWLKGSQGSSGWGA